MSNVIFDAEKSNKNVADTSRENYKDLKESGELGDQMQKVYEAVKAMKYCPTIDELAHEALAGWQKSTISGRLNDLKSQGLVTDLDGDAKRVSQYSGIKSKVWATTEELGEKGEDK